MRPAGRLPTATAPMPDAGLHNLSHVERARHGPCGQRLQQKRRQLRTLWRLRCPAGHPAPPQPRRARKTMTMLPEWDGELTSVRHDTTTGAWFVIAVHSTRLGPASGGTRAMVYPAPGHAIADAQPPCPGDDHEDGRRRPAHGRGQVRDRTARAASPARRRDLAADSGDPRRQPRTARWQLHHRPGHRDQRAGHGRPPLPHRARLRPLGCGRRSGVRRRRHRARRLRRHRGLRRGRPACPASRDCASSSRASAPSARRSQNWPPTRAPS